MIISIAGLHGTGKSTIAKQLAETLGYPYYSTGMIFRRLAVENGMNLEEFSKYVETHLEIDQQIDNTIIELAKEKANAVFEGQLPTYMIEQWRDFAILLTCDDDVRIRRMMARDQKDFAAQKQETLVREDSEHRRFKEMYGIDIRDSAKILSTFNLILDTTQFSIDDVFEICHSAVSRWMK
ncbi:MAG: cytidylate kinase [Promethearchaeia archaeon]|nr:MAG: cytidylate kinase [Candidatus Lokiarchaeia archaeon]